MRRRELEDVRTMTLGPKQRCPECGGLYYQRALRRGLCKRCRDEQAKARDKLSASHADEEVDDAAGD